MNPKAGLFPQSQILTNADASRDTCWMTWICKCHAEPDPSVCSKRWLQNTFCFSNQLEVVTSEHLLFFFRIFRSDPACYQALQGMRRIESAAWPSLWGLIVANELPRMTGAAALVASFYKYVSMWWVGWFQFVLPTFHSEVVFSDSQLLDEKAFNRRSRLGWIWPMLWRWVDQRMQVGWCSSSKVPFLIRQHFRNPMLLMQPGTSICNREVGLPCPWRS